MTQVITAVDLIRRSMYLINAVAAGETPDDADLNDALLTLNEMIDSLNLQTLAVYGSPNENWTLTPGQASYDWGLTAGATNFTSDRPAYVVNATCVRSGISTPVRVITQDEYDDIGLKSLSQPIVEQILYVNSFPLGKITCYPVPSEAVVLNLDTKRLLAGPLTLQSQIIMPPGYLRMFRYNLGVDLWPEYTNTTTDIASIKQIAKESLGKVKNSNNDITPSTFEDIPNVDSGRNWDWRNG